MLALAWKQKMPILALPQTDREPVAGLRLSQAEKR